MSRPSFNFYPDNWLHDLGLRRCSLVARGIWIDLICLMHQGEPYGHLSKSGEDLPIQFLASQCGVTTRQALAAIAELEKNGVLSRTATGTIYSRRMQRDEKNRLARGIGGGKSQDHPNVPRLKRIPSDKNKGILPHTTSVPSFGLEEEEVKEKQLIFSKETSLPKIEPGAVRQSFLRFWTRWCELTGRKQRESDACRAWVDKVEFSTESAAMECLERYGKSRDVETGAISNPDKWIYEQARDGWTGTWPPARASPNSKRDDLLAHRNEVLKIAGFLGEIKR